MPVLTTLLVVLHQFGIESDPESPVDLGKDYFHRLEFQSGRFLLFSCVLCEGMPSLPVGGQ